MSPLLRVTNLNVSVLCMPQLDFKSFISLITLGSFVAWRVLLIPSTIFSISGRDTQKVRKFSVEK